MKILKAFVAIAVLVLMLGCSSEQPAAEQPIAQPTEQPAGQPAEQVPAPVETPEQPIETPAEETTEEETPAPAEETQAAPTSSVPERCKDPDVTPEFPDGINFNVAANISVNGKAIINGYDYCPNSVTISEWYCTDGIARVKTVKCPTGSCKEGVCV